MAPVEVNPDKVRAFPSQAEFYDWLATHHDRENEIWVRIYKKASGTPTVTPTEAIEAVLCWGWIDGIRKSWDDVSFVQRYTPRKAKSTWSQINRDNVAAMIAAGKMTPHGMAHVEAAKADGRWDRAYAASSKMEMPPDLLAAIEAEPRALQTFRTLNRQNSFALAFRVGNMKTAAGREKKIRTLVDLLARGETPYPNGKADKS